MKKVICVLMLASLIVSLVPLSAPADAADLDVYTPDKGPDWVITEICPDQQGSGIGGWSGGQDPMEFVEIYNNADHALNLYDYALIYGGNSRASDKFEHLIAECTPIKPGDYLDGSTLIFADESNPCCDLSNKPVNPDECMVAPGEVVVLWVMYYEAYDSAFNEGKGLSVDDFRTFWNVPADVRVIAVDGNGNASHGGHDKNFNIKNKDVGTYGLALITDELLEAANTTGSDGLAVDYTAYDGLACWASVDFTSQLIDGSMPNYTYEFIPDVYGYAVTDAMYITDEKPYTYDIRREYMLNSYVDEPTVGTLSPVQRLAMGLTVNEGETFTYSNLAFFLYEPDVPQGAFKGLLIDGILYTHGTTFTADETRAYRLRFKLSEDGIEARSINDLHSLSVTLEGEVGGCLAACSSDPSRKSSGITKAFAGDTVYILFAITEDGHGFGSCKVTAADGTDIPVTLDLQASGTASFVMPEQDADIRVAFTYKPLPELTEAPTGTAEVSGTAAPTPDGTEGGSETVSDVPAAGGCASGLAAAVLPLVLLALPFFRRKEH